MSDDEDNDDDSGYGGGVVVLVAKKVETQLFLTQLSGGEVNEKNECQEWNDF